VGWDSVVVIAACYWIDGVWGSNSGRGEIFYTRPDRPWCPSFSLYNAYRLSFPVVKRCQWLKKEVKGRVML